VRDSLERTILRDPGYAEAHACLSLMYTNAFRFGLPVPGGGPLSRAIALARRAVELAPRSSQSHHALAQAQWFSGNLEAGMASLEDGLALNPNDTDLMGNLGMRYASRAAWDRGVPLIERSYARNPAQPGIYRTGLALYHFAHGRFEQALAEARRIGAPAVVHGWVLIAAAAAELGLRGECDAAVAAILGIDPHYGDHVAADLAARNVHPDLIAVIINALRKAALPGRETASMTSCTQPGLLSGGR
jgi:adenylate cyclase